MSTLREGMGRRLAELRRAARMTQEELASLANIDSKYLGAVERGTKNVSFAVLERLLRALKAEPYEPFLFSLKGRKTLPAGEDEALLALIRKSDKSLRPILIHALSEMIRLHQAGK